MLAAPLRKPEPFLFLKKFIKGGKSVASFAPSSKSLASETARHVRADTPQTIVELGAGTGAITVIAASRMHPESRLISVEIDADFCRILKHRCPNVEVLNCDVRDLDDKLDSLGIDQFDLLLNGLPTPSLPPAVNRAVLDVYARRGQGAYFSQLTVMPWVYKAMYVRLFADVHFKLVPANLPPGGVYHCRELRDDWADHLPGKKKFAKSV